MNLSITQLTASAPIWMPDAPLTGGVSEFRRIDALAEAHGASVSPHFLPELHVHLVAAGRAATWLEHFPLLDDLLGGPKCVDNWFGQAASGFHLGRVFPQQRPDLFDVDEDGGIIQR